MLNELLELKKEAEREILYAQAKIEVVEKLLAKVTATYEKETAPDIEQELEEEPIEDTELDAV